MQNLTQGPGLGRSLVVYRSLPRNQALSIAPSSEDSVTGNDIGCKVLNDRALGWVKHYFRIWRDTNRGTICN